MWYLTCALYFITKRTCIILAILNDNVRKHIDYIAWGWKIYTWHYTGFSDTRYDRMKLKMIRIHNCHSPTVVTLKTLHSLWYLEPSCHILHIHRVYMHSLQRKLKREKSGSPGNTHHDNISPCSVLLLTYSLYICPDMATGGVGQQRQRADKALDLLGTGSCSPPACLSTWCLPLSVYHPWYSVMSKWMDPVPLLLSISTVCSQKMRV